MFRYFALVIGDNPAHQRLISNELQKHNVAHILMSDYASYDELMTRNVYNRSLPVTHLITDFQLDGIKNGGDVIDRLCEVWQKQQRRLPVCTIVTAHDPHCEDLRHTVARLQKTHQMRVNEIYRGTHYLRDIVALFPSVAPVDTGADDLLPAYH